MIEENHFMAECLQGHGVPDNAKFCPKCGERVSRGGGDAPTDAAATASSEKVTFDGPKRASGQQINVRKTPEDVRSDVPSLDLTSTRKRMGERAHGVRSLGRIVETIGWITIGFGGLVALLRLIPKNGEEQFVAKVAFADVLVSALLILGGFAFAGLILLIVGRGVGLYAEHVAFGVGIDLDRLNRPRPAQSPASRFSKSVGGVTFHEARPGGDDKVLL